MSSLVQLGAVFWVAAQFWRIFVLQPATEDHAELDTTNQRAQQRFGKRFSLPTLLVLLLANVGVLIGQAVNINGEHFPSRLSHQLLSNIVRCRRFCTYCLLRLDILLLALTILLTFSHHLRFQFS